MVSQPQTPRLKTKLSLDIPANYSGGMIPDSPTSQFTASPFNGSVPASPTFSVSNKSPAELTVMLKDAYNTIRDKERDLTLAAEIGKSLLDNNITLKAKYENALAQLTNYQRQQSKNAIFSIQHQQATQIAPPSTSLGTIEDEEYEESDSESLFGYSTSFDTSSQSSDLPYKRKNHQNSSGMSYVDLEKIKDLEARNQELQLQLDEAVREYGESDKAKSSKIRKLESELQHFQDQCALATQKIEDITKDNERLIQKQKESFWDHKYNKTKSDDNDDFIEALLHKIQELEEQNRIVEKTKTEIERKLMRTSTDLEALKFEFEELAETSKDYEVLRLENHEKGKLIEELTESLEEQRAVVVNYQSGIWSQKTSRANSISDGSLMASTLRRLSDPDGFGMRGMFGAPPKQEKIKKSLLSEIENEFFQMFQRGDKRDVDSRLTSPAFSPITSEKDLKDYFGMGGSQDDLDYLSDDAFSFLGEFDLDNEKENRIREWFWKRWIKAIFRFLRMIWRWCRFLFILVAAVLMAIYRGPDDILPDDM